MNKNSVHYLQGINFSQVILAEKIEIKKLSPAMPVLFIFQSSLSRIQTSVEKFNPAINAKRSCKLALPVSFHFRYKKILTWKFPGQTIHTTTQAKEMVRKDFSY
jgi:hypothetical protein